MFFPPGKMTKWAVFHRRTFDRKNQAYPLSGPQQADTNWKSVPPDAPRMEGRGKLSVKYSA